MATSALVDIHAVRVRGINFIILVCVVCRVVVILEVVCLYCASYHSAVEFVNCFPSQLVWVDVVVVARRLQALLVFDCSAKAEVTYVCLGQQSSFVVLIVLVCSDLAV